MKINGENFDFVAGETILEVAQRAGIHIPSLCHVKGLKPWGSCFVCVVEQVAPLQRIVPACATAITADMEIETHSSNALATRKKALELLLSDHFGDCVAPCTLTGCPAQIDIEGFLALEAAGKFVEAAALIREQAPFPDILGRVCPRPCETVCRRNRVDAPLQIGYSKRVIAEAEREQGGPFFPDKLPSTGKTVAIIGAGPAGITAAYYLALQGHAVTVFDKEARSGGMLRYGIPAYRLPDNIIDIEIDELAARLGIECRFSQTIQSLADIKADAYLVAVGAATSSMMGIAGEDINGVYGALDVLKAIRENRDPKLGRRTLIVGGGHTAMDSARSAIRLGVETTLLYRRSAHEMPAKDEIHDAQEEGVILEFLLNPIRIEQRNTGLAVTLIRMVLSDPDERGRRRPVPLEGSETVIEVDSVVMAIGQTVDKTLMTANAANVFMAGDCVTGPDLVVTAVASARKVATRLHQFLTGQPQVGEKPIFSSSCGNLDTLPAEMFSAFPKAQRLTIPTPTVEARRHSFAQLEASATPAEMIAEAQRCLACGCSVADTCDLRIESDAVTAKQSLVGEHRTYKKDGTHPKITLETDKCIQCGACVRVCDEVKQFHALGYTGRGFGSRIAPQLGKPLAESTCDGCGQCVDVCPTAGVRCT